MTVQELNSQEGSKFLARLVKITAVFIFILAVIIYAAANGIKPLLDFWLWMKIIGGLFLIAFIFSILKIIRVPVSTVVPVEWFWGKPFFFTPGLNLFIKYLMHVRKFKWTTQKTGEKKTEEVENLNMRLQELNISEDVIHSDNGRSRMSAVIRFRVANSKKAVFEVDDPPNMLDETGRAALRDVAFRESFEQVAKKNRSLLSRDLVEIVSAQSIVFGLKIDDIEVTSIEPIGETKKYIDDKLKAQKEAEARIVAAEARKRETEIDNRSVFLIAKREGISMEEAEVVFQERMEKRAQMEAAKRGSLVIAAPGANVSVSPDRQRQNDSPRGKNVKWEKFDDDDDDDEDDESSSS